MVSEYDGYVRLLVLPRWLARIRSIWQAGLLRKEVGRRRQLLTVWRAWEGRGKEEEASDRLECVQRTWDEGGGFEPSGVSCIDLGTRMKLILN